MTEFVASNVPVKRFFGGKSKTVTPKNINRPGYPSNPTPPTGTNRPGYSAPRPSFLSGLGSDNSELPAKRRATREMFFDGDTSISKDRLDNRYTQFVENEKFKQGLKDSDRVLKDARGNPVLNANTGEPVFLGATPVFDTNTASPTFGQYVSKTLADQQMQMANKYGPTMGQVFSDMGKGIAAIGQGIVDKGTPVMQLLKSMASGIQNFFSPRTMQGPNTEGTQFQTMNFDRMAQDYTTLGPIGQAYYSMYINAGRSADEAIKLARESERQMKEEGFSDNVERIEGGYRFTGSTPNNMAQGGLVSL